jgi:membrane associated rhomboid family serine protease
LLVVGIVTLLELLNIVTGRWLNQFSIIPRDLSHLPYIASAPWLHGSIGHYLSNILPLSILSYLLMQFGLKRYCLVSALLIVMTGIFVWLFAREARHLGASGIIYGYFGYLMLAGFLSKKIWLALISIAVVFFYGGMIWGIMPTQPYISWESHLFGFISGIALAWFLRQRLKTQN